MIARKLLRLRPEERYGFFIAFALLAYVRVGLATMRFKRLNRQLPKLTALLDKLWRVRFGEERRLPVKRIAWAVNASNRWQPGDALCLPKALTAQTLLNSQRYAPQLRIGVTKDADGALKAHAWIVEQDRVVMGALKDLDDYVPFPTTSTLDKVLAKL